MGKMSVRCCISCRRSRQATLDPSFPIRFVGGRVWRAFCAGVHDLGWFRDASNEALTVVFSPSSLLHDLAPSTHVRAGLLFSKVILTGVSSLVGRLAGSCCQFIVRWRRAVC